MTTTTAPDAPASSAHPPNPDPAPRAGASPQTGENPPAGLTSLDGSETTVDATLRCTAAQRRIHASWQEERTKIVWALACSDDAGHQKRAVNIAQCCCSPLIVAKSDGSIGVCPIRCRDRLCPLCALRRAREAAVSYGNAVAAMGAARHLVLTAPAVSAPLADQLRELRDSLRRLRQQRCWKRLVLGGVYTIEVTRNAKTGLWHPHVHLIIDGEYFPQGELADAWREALGSSAIWGEHGLDKGVVVYISAVHNRHQLARYIAKYIAKPADLSRWPIAALQEYASAVRGMRMMHTFGSLHGVKLRVDDENIDPGTSECLLGLAELDWRAIQGHPEAHRAVALLRAIVPHCSRWLGAARDPVLDAWAHEVEDKAGELRHWLGRVRRLTSSRPSNSNPNHQSSNNRNKNKESSSLQLKLFEKI